MIDVIYDKERTSPKRLRKLLEISNKKNELLTDKAKKFTIQFDEITVIEFSKEDWEILNKKLFVEQKDIRFFPEQKDIEFEGLITLGLELTGEQAGVSHYKCVEVEANIYYKHPIPLEMFIILLKSFNEKTESSPDEPEEIIIKFNETTLIEFSKYDWKVLNNKIEQELSNEPKESIKLWLELTGEQAGVSYYDCFDFEIDGLTLLVKTQKGLEKISKEIKNAEYYLTEAYNYYNYQEEDDLGKKLSEEEKELSRKEKDELFLKAFGFRELGILMLARIYDDHAQVVSLPNILKSIHSNFDEWSDVSENKLKKENLDQSQLGLDQKKISKKLNEVVRKLFTQRDKSIAHLDKAYVFRIFESPKKEKNWGFPEYSELEKLINIAKELRDRYSIALNLPLDES